MVINEVYSNDYFLEQHNQFKKDIWNTGLYIRLSQEDSNKTESDSVINQRSMLTTFINDNASLKLIDAYIDDGFTGTDFNRPAFTKMIKDIKDNKINCVIVKDLSRFGRDYIGVGNYLEQLFPFLNCRFISILDNLDSMERPNEISSVFVRFKHIMNDHYSKEISLKTRAVCDMYRREGKFMCAFAPYGYKKHPENKHKLIFDEEAADVVKSIFKWRIDGFGITGLSKKLNRLGILSPGLYRKEKGIYKNHNTSCGTLWHPNTVKRILRNIIYTGTLKQKKSTTRNHKDKRVIQIKDDEQITVHNTHDAIVSLEDFNTIQKLFSKSITTSGNTEQLHLFSGFLRCADCGKTMIRTPKKTAKKLYVYYRCKTYSQISENECTHSHSISHDLLYDTVMHIIRLQISTIVDMKNILDNINTADCTQKQNIDLKVAVKNKERQINVKTQLKMGLYEDYKSKIISQNDYIDMRETYDNQIKNIKEEISQLNQEMQIVNDIQSNNTKWINNFAKYYSTQGLTRNLLISLVEKIYISSDKSIIIRFLYRDEYQKTTDYIKHFRGELYDC